MADIAPRETRSILPGSPYAIDPSKALLVVLRGPVTSLSAVASGDLVLILWNPKAGRRGVADQVQRLSELLRRRGLAVEISEDCEPVCHEANRQFRAGRLRALVGAGGDGTAAELANRTLPGMPLALFPAGTSNLLAGYLGFTPSPERLCQAISAGCLLKLDAGLASGRVFHTMASCGFDAEVVQQVHQRRGRFSGGHLTYWSYVKPILQTIGSYTYPAIRVDWAQDGSVGRDFSSSAPVIARWVFVFNLPRYGWGLPIAPWAKGNDGLLDLCAYHRGRLVAGLYYLLATQVGFHWRLRDFTTTQSKRLRITSDRPVAYQLDGDPGGYLPLEIEVCPDRLTFIDPTCACR